MHSAARRWRGPARPARATCGARRERVAAARLGSATALLDEPTAARRRHTGDGGERRLTGAETAARHDGDGRAASEVVGVAWRRSGRRHGRRGGRGDGGAHEAVGRRARGSVGRQAARARPAVGTRGTLSRQRL
jgi:hypothetical protein